MHVWHSLSRQQYVLQQLQHALSEAGLTMMGAAVQEKTTDYIVGFDELGGKDDFSTDVRCRPA